MLSNVLIIDKRKELSIKYKKSIENENTDVIIAKTLKDAMAYVQSTEPDLLIISDSIDEDLADFCKKIRVLTYNTRPAIVALSKSADTSDRIRVLESGADDFISEPVNIEEFKMRIKAHLRRDIELNLDIITSLPNQKYVYKSLKRLINSENKQAVLLMSIENLAAYKSIYSDVAGSKIIQTLTAITKSALDVNDFFGQLNEENFVIITNTISAEKMAAFLTFAFDTVAPKFYSVQDAARGYTLLKGDGQAEMRAKFVSISISGIINNYETISSVDLLLDKLYSIKKLAKFPGHSGYVIDRIKLSGENSVITPDINNRIYIQEPDEALSLLLKTTLELQGYSIIENIENNQNPFVIIMDSGDDLSDLDFCRQIKENSDFSDTKIIVTTTVHNKSAILDAGADLYLPKPYEISELLMWIDKFLKM